MNKKIVKGKFTDGTEFEFETEAKSLGMVFISSVDKIDDKDWNKEIESFQIISKEE